MQDNNPNHQYDFSSFELELITKMGQNQRAMQRQKLFIVPLMVCLVWQLFLEDSLR